MKIYDIILDESSRENGHREKAMELLEIKVKKLGLKYIGLHLFGHNHVARSLYQKMWY